jgi:hypothetical protein
LESERDHTGARPRRSQSAGVPVAVCRPLAFLATIKADQLPKRRVRNMQVASRLIYVCVALTAFPVLAQETPPPPSTSQETIAALHAACDADIQKLCPGVQPGGGRILACLKQNKDAVSDTCKQAIVKAMQGPS